MSHNQEPPSPRSAGPDEALRVELRRLEALVATRDATVARLTSENRRLEVAFAVQRDSRWSMLGDVLRRRPFGSAEFVQVVRLGAKLLQSRLRPSVQSPPAAAVPLAIPGSAVAPVIASVPVDATASASPVTSDALAPYRINVPSSALGARRHVVHVIANFMTGGSSRLVVDLVEGLGAHYEQCVLTSFAPTPAAYEGVPVEVLTLDSSPKTFSDYFARARPDLVHVHYWGSTDEPWYRLAFDALDTLDCPVIENVNTPVAPLRSKRVDRYVYVSDYVKDQFGDGRDAESVIYPGSNLAMFAPPAARGDDGDTIGMVYRLERDKLDENSIDPLIETVRRRPRTRVLVVGGGTLLAGFRHKVSAAGLDGSFEFTGFVRYEDLPDFYDRMSVFVAPVWQESFGQVSTFAMSMGIPVVGYATGAIPEIIRDDALVARFPDASALAALIVNLLDDPVRRALVATRNREHARTWFTVEGMVGRYMQMYGALTAHTD